MKIEPKHVFTSGANPPSKATAQSLANIFKAHASFKENTPSLKGRAEIQPISKAHQLTKDAQAIIREVPTPFIKR